MVMISVAFKLTQKDIMYNRFRIFKFHIDKTHLCCTSFIILYFDCSMYPIGWIYYNLFIHSFAHRHLGFSQVFDVVYGATITFVYIFPGAYVQEFLVHIYIKAKCWKCGRLTLWDNDRTIFPGSCANLLAGYEILCLSTCPSTWDEQTFQFFQPNTCKISCHVALNCISRHITNDRELFLILSLPHGLPCLYL